MSSTPVQFELNSFRSWSDAAVRQLKVITPTVQTVLGEVIMLVPMKVDYGVRTLVYLAQQDATEFTSTSDIAQAQHIPEPYLLRICSELQKSGLIESRRGPKGGHKLAKSGDQISVSDVVNSVDYSLAPIDCVEEPGGCRLSGACSQRDLWSDVEAMLLEHLSNVKISELMNQQMSMTAAAPVRVNF